MYLYRILNKIERVVQKGLGKGYGAASVSEEVHLLKKLLTAPKLGIDIGGNAGEYSAQLRTVYPDMEIHIFEPAEVNQQKLKARFDTDANIFINNSAIAESNRKTELFSNMPGSHLASLTKRKLDHVDVTFNLSETIQTIRFEDYWQSVLGMRNIDIAKIDVEGHELDVLNGFGKAIFKVKIIQFEFGGCNIDTKTYFQDFWYFFKDLPFKIYRITPFGLEHIARYTENQETFLTTNFLCINQNIK